MTGTSAPLRVAVIIGSTREGRAGDRVAEWFAAKARTRPEFVVTVLDLADFAFPARYPERPTPAMTAFTSELADADAFVLVTPEYNRSFPAPLKQAIDYGYDEWRAKPVSFVSYGCQSTGIYAVEQLRSVCTELHAVSVRDVVGLDLLGGGFDEQGWPVDDDERRRTVHTMLDQLAWWGFALRDARAARPYVS